MENSTKNGLNERVKNGVLMDVTNKKKENECPRCKSLFSTKQSLATHMRTAQYCIEDVKPMKQFDCQYCGKTLSSKQMLTYHDNTCNDKKRFVYEQKLKEYESFITNKQTTSFFDSNVIIQCKMISSIAQMPRKISSMVFQLYPAIDSSICIDSLSSATISTGIILQIAKEWCAYIMADDSNTSLLVSSICIDNMYQKPIQITVFNMTKEPIIIMNSNVIAQLVFKKSPESVNVHFNYI